MNKVKKIIALIICLLMAIGGYAYADDVQLISAPVKDYEGHWAEATIQKWMDEGKVTGYEDGSYKPDNNVTRAEFVKMVNGIIDYDGKGEVTYNDVPSTEWFYDFISVAQEIGYISGYSDNEFGPNDYITREQAASILSRIQYLNNNVTGIEKFNDNDNISSWAKGSVGAASEAGFIKGYEGNFNPLNNLTRAEALTMLDNVLVNAKNVVIYNSGSELNDAIVEGDLIIANTVGEGDVYLTNLDVNREIKVYGGGVNSLYFNNVKVSKISVEKDKVRLILDNGTTIEEIAVSNETVLENENGEIAKVTVTGNGEVTLSGKFEEVTIAGKGNITLKDTVITKLIVNEPITIQGTGTITTLEANSNGIEYESKVEIKKTTLGEGVKEEPVGKKEETVGSGNGGSSNPSPNPNTESNVLRITATLPDGQTKIINTEEFEGTENIIDFLVAEIKNILEDVAEYQDTINDYLEVANSKIDGLTINGNNVNTEEAWETVSNYFSEIEMEDGSRLSDELFAIAVYDGVTIGELEEILGLYESSKLEEYIEVIESNLTTDIKYNGESAEYKLTVGNTNYEAIEEIVAYALENLTNSIDDFFGEVESITIESTYGSKTSSVKIEKVVLP